MRVLLYGSGAVGLGIAASLFDSGWEVDLIASGNTKEHIQRSGIKRIGMFKNIEVDPSKVKVYEKLAQIEVGEYEYILVSTKAISNEENAQEIHQNKHLLKGTGKLVIFQNGWGTDEPYLKYFAKEQVYNARVITGFSRPEKSVSEVTAHAAPILIGSIHGQPVSPVEPLARAIEQGGIPCEVTDEVQKALWAKMLFNCTLNPLGAILNVSYGGLVECKNSVVIMDKVIEEIFEVMKSAGYKTYWSTAEEYKKAFYNEIVPPTVKHRSSTLQDIEKKIKTEIDTLNGSIVRLGEKLGISVPCNLMLYSIIKAIECKF